MSEDDYKPDLELLDRYQQFSSELLRLSLLGMALLGFFFDKIANAPYFSMGSRRLLLGLTALTALSCLVSASGALAHRYFSTDGIFYHIRSLRFRGKQMGAAKQTSAEPADATVSSIRSDNYHSFDVAKDEGARNARYHKSGQYLGVSTGALVVAAFCAVMTIATAAVSYEPERSTQGVDVKVG